MTYFAAFFVRCRWRTIRIVRVETGFFLVARFNTRLENEYNDNNDHLLCQQKPHNTPCGFSIIPNSTQKQFWNLQRSFFIKGVDTLTTFVGIDWNSTSAPRRQAINHGGSLCPRKFHGLTLYKAVNSVENKTEKSSSLHFCTVSQWSKIPFFRSKIEVD